MHYANGKAKEPHRIICRNAQSVFHMLADKRLREFVSDFILLLQQNCILVCFVSVSFVFFCACKYDLWTDEICVSDATSECNMLSLHNCDYVTTHTRELAILAVVRGQMCLSSRQIDLNVMNECWCTMKMNWIEWVARVKLHADPVERLTCRWRSTA